MLRTIVLYNFNIYRYLRFVQNFLQFFSISLLVSLFIPTCLEIIYSQLVWKLFIPNLFGNYLIPNVFGTTPFNIGVDIPLILAVCVVGLPIVIIVPFISIFLT